ncbi:hypothetical protein HELRODRAFT_183773 [Helobdella robusta]|uniref:Ig-like domain-containing protein n=1 Tax=Helobdella robusta TaxID=6412 RepID=T1FK64_HELRO|nr:hypothetical protein HELRODRAFT_183773 [Helobdella robusta]ESO10307.1 hypothetical protein HELRODRAFT_183773 [Helobdella robusta]
MKLSLLVLSLIIFIFDVNVTLTCPLYTSGNVTWLKNDVILQNGNKYVMNHANKTMTINMNPFASESDLGPYKCIFLDSFFSFILKSPPTMLKAPKHLSLTDGNDLHLECFGYSYPPPARVKWSKDGGPEMTSLSDPRAVASLENKVNIGIGRLLISGVATSDQGLYSCTLENSVGGNSSEIMVRINSKYAALWPFIGILVEVVAIIIIIVIVGRKKARSKVDNKEN